MFSSICWGKEGDVYYCETIKNLNITITETREKGTERFTFKRNHDSLVFGQGNILVGMRLEVTDSYGELFTGGDEGNSFRYLDSLFVYSSTYLKSVTVIIASCEVF